MHRYDVTTWAMPTPNLDIPKDMAANTLAATLMRQSLDHATLEVTAQAR